MNLLDRIKGGSRDVPAITSISDLAQVIGEFTFGGLSYTYPLGFGNNLGFEQTLAGRATEMAPNNFVGLASAACQSNGVVFACMMVRQLVFSSVRFQWQRLRGGKPSDTFGTSDLFILEQPWPGGTTQDLLSRMIQDADLAGNSYWVIDRGEMVRLRPDWVDVVLEPRDIRGGAGVYGGGQAGWRKLGYTYTEGGRQSGETPVGFLADEVVHFAPIPDPLARFRGMSWLTPVLREIRNDHSMTRHQTKFWDQGATVNLVIKNPVGADQDQVRRWKEQMEDKHAGVENAWKNLYLYPGADVEAVGSTLKDADFDNVRAGGEVRIAAAAGVPPVIVGLSKGLDSSTYSNYAQARRRLADGTAHPLWANLAGSLAHILNPPGGDVRLWYDSSDVPFLREDEKDAAAIQQTRAATIFSLISSGFTPDSAVAAVEANDFGGLLKWTGLTSVQLQAPGQQQSTPPTPAKAATNGSAQQGGSTDDAED